MVKTRENLTGKRFGRLIVIKQAEDYIEPKRGTAHSQWLCQCDCGSTPIVVVGTSLKRRATQSCGCLAKERISKANKKYNHIEQNGDTGIGRTTNTNAKFYFDWEDYNKICNLCWVENITKNGMHKLQAYDPDTKMVVSMHAYLGYKNYDHADRNELNNCKSNLRKASTSQNAQNHNKQSNNTSGFIGVIWNKKNQKWIARINDKTNHRIYLGSFIDKKDAIKSRLKAELKYYGEFAPQRYLFEQYGIKKEE